ncbi:MAG: hypothetical protein GX781_09860 [Clostridiales bacterium]|nr:hypothetical protein [Clostridiales bacterium]
MMHKKSRAVLAFLVMIILLSGAISLGAYRGWSEKKLAVEKSMDSLFEMLTARREIGSNILSVAQRYLPKDHEMMAGLHQDIADLARESSFTQLANANEHFEQHAASLLATLKSLPSVQNNDRDLMYVEQMLPQALEKSARMTEQTEYNQQAMAFNTEMDQLFSGKIAQLLGIKPVEEFTVLEGKK